MNEMRRSNHRGREKETVVNFYDLEVLVFNL